MRGRITVPYDNQDKYGNSFETNSPDSQHILMTIKHCRPSREITMITNVQEIYSTRQQAYHSTLDYHK